MKRLTIRILIVIFVLCVVGLAVALSSPVIWTVFPSARPSLTYFAGHEWLIPGFIVGLIGSGIWCRALESREADR